MNQRPTPAQRSDFADFFPLQTRWMDNDAYGHMNNTVHYALFDTAINGYLIERDVLNPLQDDTYGLVVESGCRYHKEMSYPDRVTAGLRVSSLGKSSVRYEVGLFRNDDHSAAAEGHFVHVYVERATHRPTPINDARREVLRSLRQKIYL